jgi:hypothetical protein
VRVTVVQDIPSDRIDAFYGFYRAAFAPLQTRAAARHVLTRDEFNEEMRDRRIDKYVAWDGDTAVGLTTMTNDLASVLWIEPAFYVARHPEHAARRTLFYLGYILVDPSPGVSTFRAFRLMAETLLQRVADAGGVLAFDVSRYNDDGEVGPMIARLLRGFGTEAEAVDVQTYYTAVLGAASDGVPSQRSAPLSKDVHADRHSR